MTPAETLLALALAVPVVLVGDFGLFVLRERQLRRARERAVLEWRLREVLAKLRAHHDERGRS